MSEWLEAEQRVERAQQLTESLCWDEALSELDIAISINPHNALWHAQRGFLLEELNRHAEAAEAYERSLHLEPNDAEVSMALANVLLHEGRFHRAVVVLEGVAKLDSTYEPAYCYRIRAYAELGLHDKAEEMFYLAQELEDDCPNCFFFLAGSLAARGQFPRAIYCWHRTLELAPDYEGVYRRIGQAYRTMGKLRRARAYFLQELRGDPGNTELLFELGEVALACGQPCRAAAKFEQVLELDPMHDQARRALAHVLLMLDKPAAALRCLERIEAHQPELAETAELNSAMGHALLGLGCHEQAAIRLERVVEREPENAAIWGLLGDCYLAIERMPDGVRCYSRAVEAEPLDPGNRRKLGLCLYHLGQTSAAIPHLETALRLLPDSDEIRYALAQAHLDCRHWSEAGQVIGDKRGGDAQRIKKAIWKGRLRQFLLMS